jgi:hypothetical protein
MRISENREGPSTAKEVAFKCPECQKLAIVVLPYQPTALERMHIIKAALDEHRKVCTAAPPEVERVYDIWYPRKGW